jgi:hypothetical protein
VNWREKLRESLVNIPGTRTSRKIVVFESDDWGTIRMRDRRALQALKQFGVRAEQCPYLSNDHLEAAGDMQALFDVLSRYRDSHGRPAKFTFNTIMANPDFQRIRESSFLSYFWEHFHTTYQRYGYHVGELMQVWNQGMQAGVMRPQFHGREHVQINRWLRGLRAGSKESLLAFEHGILGVSTTVTTEKRKSYLPAFDFDDVTELEGQHQILSEGLELFEKTFGFRSASFIAPNYTWSSSLEDTLVKNDVTLIQGARAQRAPQPNGDTKIVRHSMGQRGSDNQRYLIRNVQFEPAFPDKRDWVNMSLAQMELAFFWRKPAIVTSHRVNYMGGISEQNRSENLDHLGQLLKKLLSKHPDVEFMFTDELRSVLVS